MPRLVAILVALFAWPAVAAPQALVRDKTKVALLPLSCERGVPQDMCKVLGDSIALAVSDAPGLEPITPGDLEVMMGAQALSELSNCGGEECFMGDESLRIDAAWLLGGTLTRIGDNTRVVLRLIDLERGAILDRGDVTVPADDEEALDVAVRRLALRLLARRGLIAMEAEPRAERVHVVELEDEPSPRPLLFVGLGTAGLGGAGVATGIVLGGLALVDVEAAKAAALSGSDETMLARARDARAKAWGADVLLAAGGAILVGGVVMAVAGGL